MTKKELIKMVDEALDKYDVIYIEELMAFLPIGKDSFYRKIPVGSDEYDRIKERINTNKLKRKVDARMKWAKSGNPTLEIANYRLLADEKELMALGSSTQNTTIIGSQNVQMNSVVLSKLTTEELLLLKDMGRRLQEGSGGEEG